MVGLIAEKWALSIYIYIYITRDHRMILADCERKIAVDLVEVEGH